MTPRMKEGDNALLHLLRQKCGCTVDDVCRVLQEAGDEEAQTRLVNSKAVDGCTPLMLAVGGGGGHGNKNSRAMVQVARFLLTKGAAATLSAHSVKRRTAADYCDLHKKPWLARELRALEQEQQERLQKQQRQEEEQQHQQGQGQGQHGDAAGNGEKPEAGDRRGVAIYLPGDRNLRCVICGDRLGGSKFRVAQQGVESGHQTNRLIADFFTGQGLGNRPTIQEALSRPALHSFNARKRFTREFTEVLAVLSRLQRIVSPGGGSPEESWHVVDLCCGKGFLATLVAICFPTFVVTAVDRLTDQYLPHYEAAGIDNVRYAQLDVMAKEFPDQIAKLAADEDHGNGRPVVVLGMHLCGLLSVRALELLRKVPGARGVVLAPCCLPNKKFAEDTPESVYEGTDNHLKFQRWCDFLEARMRKEAEGAWTGPAGPATPPLEDHIAPPATGESLPRLLQCLPCKPAEPAEPACRQPTAKGIAPEPCFSREVDDGIISEKRIILSAMR